MKSAVKWKTIKSLKLSFENSLSFGKIFIVRCNHYPYYNLRRVCLFYEKLRLEDKGGIFEYYGKNYNMNIIVYICNCFIFLNYLRLTLFLHKL